MCHFWQGKHFVNKTNLKFLKAMENENFGFVIMLGVTHKTPSLSETYPFLYSFRYWLHRIFLS